MRDEPHRYSADDVHVLRMPETTTADGVVTSTWDLLVERPVQPSALATIAFDIARGCETQVELTAVSPREIVLRFQTIDHPLEPDVWPAVDCVLKTLHAVLGISQLNGSPRRHWRTFGSQPNR